MKSITPIIFGILTVLTLDSPAYSLPVATVAAFFAATTPAWVITATTVLINTVLSVAASALINVLLRPNPQRQASLVTMAIGEQPRVCILGEGAVPGLLDDGL